MQDKGRSKGELREAIDKSIQSAIDRGALDATANAGAIALLRSMCDTLDAGAGEPIVWRYVTPASITALCDKLGLLPTERQLEQAASKADSTLNEFRRNSIVGNSKWVKRM